jgi:hypothetical protein
MPRLGGLHHRYDLAAESVLRISLQRFAVKRASRIQLPLITHSALSSKRHRTTEHLFPNRNPSPILPQNAGFPNELQSDGILASHRASSIGIDPFRLRSGIWTELTLGQRRKLFTEIRKEIETSIPVLEKYVTEIDPIERLRVQLGIAVQHARLEILNRWNSEQL